MSSPTTFKFDEKLTATLEQLKTATGASSKAEIVRRAIALMQIVQQATENDEKLILQRKDDDGKTVEREIILT